MSQADIIKFLEKKKNRGKWFTTREIAESLEVNLSNTNAALNRLRKSKDIDMKILGIYSRHKNRISLGSPHIYRIRE